jgi:hypothetical protein
MRDLKDRTFSPLSGPENAIQEVTPSLDPGEPGSSRKRGDELVSSRKSRKGPTTRTACSRCRRSKVKVCDNGNLMILDDVPNTHVSAMANILRARDARNRTNNAYTTCLKKA